jgi:hypothetical protein
LRFRRLDPPTDDDVAIAATQAHAVQPALPVFIDTDRDEEMPRIREISITALQLVGIIGLILHFPYRLIGTETWIDFHQGA